MDREFPSVLFPSDYNNEPPESALGHCAGSWGSYGQLQPDKSQASSSTHRFKVQHEATGEVWRHTEPVPMPLFFPKHARFWPSKPANPLDFSKHLQNFFVDYPLDAFSSTVNLLGDTKRPSGRHKKVQKLQAPFSMKKMSHLADKFKSQSCPGTQFSVDLDTRSHLLSDAVHSIPVELLGSLLHEELSLQSLEARFCEGHTGGALDYIPFTSSSDGAPQSGCLVYCANGADKLAFQQVALQPGAVVCSDDTCTFLLKGPVQQISSRSICGHSCVAVRSMYHCGVWAVSSSQQPHLLQAMSSAERISCISVSPHVVGEQLVASESGAAHLWRTGHGMELVRTEDSNLYFNGQSSWRWCEFSAHPRVMLYADRTGAELTDIRVEPSSCHTLFRISQTAECRSGERLLMCRYLNPLHSFHHIVTTQYSAYIMDERFPCVPMLKWDHMMDSPPVFCQVLPGSGPLAGGTAKVLLGSQSTQEVMLLQYSGGGAEACVARGPPQALLRPRDSVEHLPMQIPHRTQGYRDRLSHPATGLTAVHLQRSASKESFCVLQLLQTGDVFYQILEKASSPTEHLREGHEQGSLPLRQEEQQLSQQSTSIWKQWLQKLARSPKSKKSSGVMAKSLLHLSIRKPRDIQQRKKVQKDLKKSMWERSLPVCAAQEIEPLRVDVQAEDWSDEVSSRLTAGWDGKEAWQQWWVENFGANVAEKTKALRKKRRRERDARRVSGLTLLAMSGGFTSSSSYQSELSDWPWSDAGGAGEESQLEPPPTQDSPDRQRLTPSLRETERPGPSSARTPETDRPHPSSARTPETDRPRPSSARTPETDRPRPSSARTSETDRPCPSSARTPETDRPRPSSARTPETDRPRPSSARTPETDTPRPSSGRTPEAVRPRPSSARTPETVRLRPLVETLTRERRTGHLQSEASQSLDSSSAPSYTFRPSSLSQNTFGWSQSSQRPSQSSQPRKKSRMGF